LSYSLGLSFFSLTTLTAATCALSLHDALPIFPADLVEVVRSDVRDSGDAGRAVGVLELRVADFEDHGGAGADFAEALEHGLADVDRKSTRLNSSHVKISYAVFCLKKKRYGHSS